MSTQENGSKKRDRRKSKSKRTSTTSSQPNASSSAAHLKHERDSRASTGTLHDYAAFDGLTGGDSGSWLSKAQPLSRADLQEHPLADTQRGQALSDASDESFKLEDPRSSVNYGVTSSSTINHKTNGKKRALSINTSSGQESEPSSSDKSPQSATISFPSLLQNPSPTKLQTAQTSPFKRMRLDASGSASKLDSGKKDHHPTDPSRTLVECDDSNDETPLFISQPKPSPSPQPAEKKIVSPKKQPPPGPTLVIRHPSQTPPVKGTARRYTKKPESSSSDSDIEVSQISLPQPSSSQSPGKDKKTSLMSTSPRKLSHVKDMHHRPADDPLAHIFDSEEDVERLIKPSPKTKSNSKSKSVKPLDMSNGNVSSASDEETETRSTGKSLPRSKTAAL